MLSRITSIEDLRRAFNTNLQIDPMQLDESDNTLLHHVLKDPEADPYIVINILRRHVILDHQNDKGQTIFHIAAKYASPEVLTTILDFPGEFYDDDGCNTNLPDNDGNILYHYASAENIAILGEYNYNINQPNNVHMTPLLDAIFKSEDRRAIALLEAGADILAIDSSSNNAFHYCISRPVINHQILDILISSPHCPINKKNILGNSPLDLAILKNDRSLVKKIWNTWAFSEIDLQRWITSPHPMSSYLRVLSESRRSFRAHYV